MNEQDANQQTKEAVKTLLDTAELLTLMSRVDRGVKSIQIVVTMSDGTKTSVSESYK